MAVARGRESQERELPVLACYNDGRTPPAERPNHGVEKTHFGKQKIHTDVTGQLRRKTIIVSFTPSIILFTAQKCQLTLTVIDCVAVEQY